MLSGAVQDVSGRVGLALAGGGPEGAVYEIGVLRALDESLDGVDFTRLPVYVGVSAGAFLAANLANHITTAQNVRAIVKDEPGEHPFIPQTFFTPAVAEFVRGGLRAPVLLAQAVWDFLRHPGDLSSLEILSDLSRALPLGVFDNDPIREYLATIYSIKGRTDDFRELDARLVVVATELDTGRAVRFGDAGYDTVPISRAIQASCALPGIYPPVLIQGRHYVDGVLLKTMHASVALEQGVELVICVNPIVPVNTRNASFIDGDRRNLRSQGIATVLSQTFRTLIHSRMTVGMAAYAPRFPHQDLVLFEPQPDDYRMFFTNIFSFASRKAICDHAYHVTRRHLLRRFDELAPVFARHGITLQKDVLQDEGRDLWDGVGLAFDRRRPEAAAVPVAVAMDRVLTRLEHLIADHDAVDGRPADRA